MSKEITIMTPEQVEVKFELAGIWSRLLALVVDNLLQALAFLIIFAVMYLTLPTLSSDSGPATWIIVLLIVLVVLIAEGYHIFFEATHNGQTPGKSTMGIRVVLDTGHPIDFRAALLRNIMRLVDILPVGYAVGLVCAFISPEFRRTGDYVGGTLVVRVAPNERADYAPSQYDRSYQPLEPQIEDGLIPMEAMPYLSSIGKDEYRAVRHFLDRRNELEPHVAYQLAIQLLEPVAAKLHVDKTTIVDPISFLVAVSKEWERRVARV